MRRMSIGTIVVAASVLLVSQAASASPVAQYVLKHPKREHCKARYVKKTRKVKIHGRKVKRTVCRYVAPKSPHGLPPVIAPTPFSTTTTLSVTGPTGETCTDGKRELEVCHYTVSYSTVNGKGESPPGSGPVLRERIPPSSELRNLSIPSGTEIAVVWFVNKSGECRISLTEASKFREYRPSYTCEKAAPGVVLVAEYLNPATGWLTSESERVVVR